MNEASSITQQPTSGSAASDMLKALKIRRLITVDDDHATPAGLDKEVLIAGIRAEQADLTVIQSVLMGMGTGGGRDSETMIAAVDACWDKFSDEQRDRLAESLGDWVSLQNDAQQELRAALREVLAADIEITAMTYAQWRAAGLSVLKDGVSTLLLVDRNFEKENGGAKAGDEIIKEVLSRSDLGHVFVGLLTQLATDLEQEVAIEAEVAAEINNTRQVVVIAKSRLQSQALDTFAEALRVLFHADDVAALRKYAARVFREAGHDGAVALENISKYGVLASVEAAMNEGAFETDFLLRLAWAKAERCVDRAIRAPSLLQGALQQLRDAPDIKVYLKSGGKPDDIDSLSWEQKFLDKESLAELALPLEVGDIFRVYDLWDSKSSDRYYILLSQACDLQIRGNGKRVYGVKNITLTRVRPAPKNDNGEGYRAAKFNEYSLGFLDKDDKGRVPWIIQFVDQLHVPAMALDACVASGSGLAELTVGQPMPPALPIGWAKRLDHLRKTTEKAVDSYRSLTDTRENAACKDLLDRHVAASLLGVAHQHKDGITGRIDPSSESIRFGVERYARLTGAMARGVFIKMAHYRARPALDAPIFADPDTIFQGGA
jgi:hypothetical protein